MTSDNELRKALLSIRARFADLSEEAGPTTSERRWQRIDAYDIVSEIDAALAQPEGEPVPTADVGPFKRNEIAEIRRSAESGARGNLFECQPSSRRLLRALDWLEGRGSGPVGGGDARLSNGN